MTVHTVRPVHDRQDNLIGAFIFLSPDEVREARINGTVEITVDYIE